MKLSLNLTLSSCSSPHTTSAASSRGLTHHFTATEQVHRRPMKDSTRNMTAIATCRVPLQPRLDVA